MDIGHWQILLHVNCQCTEHPGCKVYGFVQQKLTFHPVTFTHSISIDLASEMMWTLRAVCTVSQKQPSLVNLFVEHGREIGSLNRQRRVAIFTIIQGGLKFIKVIDFNNPNLQWADAFVQKFTWHNLSEQERYFLIGWPLSIQFLPSHLPPTDLPIAERRLRTEHRPFYTSRLAQAFARIRGSGRERLRTIPLHTPVHSCWNYKVACTLLLQQSLVLEQFISLKPDSSSLGYFWGF